MKKKNKKKGDKGMSFYKKKLDKVFALFIRLKETKEVNGKREGQCITCRNIKPFEELDAGHFISRVYLKYRWSPINVHIQCRYCNRFREGEKDKYFLWMIKKYGQKKVEQMVKDKDIVVKLDIDWLKKEIKKYKNKIKKLST